MVEGLCKVSESERGCSGVDVIFQFSHMRITDGGLNGERQEQYSILSQVNSEDCKTAETKEQNKGMMLIAVVVEMTSDVHFEVKKIYTHTKIVLLGRNSKLQ